MSPLQSILKNDAKSLDVGKLFSDTKKRYTAAKKQSLSDTGPQRFRVDFGFATIELIGNLINKIQEIRNGIEETTDGLTAFDADLAGLKARYRNVYKKLLVDAPALDAWTLEDWADYEDNLEGPVFYWNISDCRERWGIPFGAPECEGPDLLMALSLLHQSGIAAEFEREIVESFYGIMDLTLQDFTQFYGDVARDAANSIIDGIGKITDFLTPGRGFKTAVLLVGGAAAVYYGYKLTKDDKETNDALRPTT